MSILSNQNECKVQPKLVTLATHLQRRKCNSVSNYAIHICEFA